MCQYRRHFVTVITSENLFIFNNNIIIYNILSPQFLLFYLALYIVLDVAALQFVGSLKSVLFLTIHYLCFNHYYLFFYAYNTSIYTHPPPFYLTHCLRGDLGTFH